MCGVTDQERVVCSQFRTEDVPWPLFRLIPMKHVERLTAAGVPDAQARAEASALRDVLAESLDTTIATKGDVRDLKADIARLEASTKTDIARLESNIEKMELRLVIKLGGLMAAIMGLGVAVLRLLH